MVVLQIRRNLDHMQLVGSNPSAPQTTAIKLLSHREAHSLMHTYEKGPC